MLNVTFYLLLCWVSLHWTSLRWTSCWTSLCWMSWRRNFVCRYAECHVFIIVMLNVVMLSVLAPLFWVSRFCYRYAECRHYADRLGPVLILTCSCTWRCKQIRIHSQGWQIRLEHWRISPTIGSWPVVKIIKLFSSVIYDLVWPWQAFPALYNVCGLWQEPTQSYYHEKCSTYEFV